PYITGGCVGALLPGMSSSASNHAADTNTLQRSVSTSFLLAFSIQQYKLCTM
ncbi:hypothetical protein GOODEAATRI_029731, partial [Goodea atripinnis]